MIPSIRTQIRISLMFSALLWECVCECVEQNARFAFIYYSNENTNKIWNQVEGEMISKI